MGSGIRIDMQSSPTRFWERRATRKALAEGIEPEAIRQVAVLAISTAGYPAAIAAYGWINEVLDQEG